MTAFFAAVCAFWVLRAADLFAGHFLVPRLRKPSVVPRSRVAVVFAARDEAAAVGAAVDRLLAQDHPSLEIVAVDDRSTDGTGAVLAARSDARLKAVRVDALPAGWLGKTHALHRGAEASSGEWLLFTDADVMMEPSAVSAAVAEAERRGLGHLTAIPGLLNRHYVETMFTSFFILQFNLRYRPWAARFRGPWYAGIGAFNLVRRDVYERFGGHKALALEIADDMTLGRLAKRAGARSMLFSGRDLVRVRWVEGVRGVFSSLHKNAFRGLEYSVAFLAVATAGILAVDVAPFVWAAAGEGPARLWAWGAVAAVAASYLAGALEDPRVVTAFPAHPFSAVLFLVILWRSAADAVLKGGVTWRGTFYPLEDLKKSRM